MAIRLKNATSSVSRVGYIVSINPTDPDSFIYTVPNSTKAIGIITEAVPYRQFCTIATIGDKASVYVASNINKGDVIRAIKSNDRASLGSCVVAKTGDSPYLRIGEALITGSGLIPCVLDLTYQGTDNSGWVPYDGATRDVNLGDHFFIGRFIVRPGEAAAGLAGFVMQPGTLLTVPVAGTLEFDGTGIYLTAINHRRFISMASDSLITTQTATTILPTTLWTGITNADELSVHRVYVIKGCGLINNQNSAANVTIAIGFGGTIVVTLTTPVVKLTNDPFRFEIFITIRATGVIPTGQVSTHGILEVGTAITHTVTESTAIDTTIANDMTLTAVWSAEHADNWLKLTQCWLSVED